MLRRLHAVPAPADFLVLHDERGFSPCVTALKEISTMTREGMQVDVDREKAEAFASRLLAALNDGALCLMVSVGHRTGLFDIMRESPPATSQELAARAGLNERYVREWLGAMVTARVVTIDPATGRFSLPAEHAAFLTRRAVADNMAVFAQYIAVMGAVEDDIVECFRRGGGVPYERFRRFHEVMSEDSGQSVLSSLESHILPLVPGLMDRLAQGIRVLDVGCGRGRIMNKLAGLYPRSRFMGMDLSAEAIAFARDEAAQRSLDNSQFVAIDLSHFDEAGDAESFDLITTFDAIHDQAKPLNVLKGIHRALKPEGVYLMQDISGTSHMDRDIDHPIGTFLYTISCMHCMTVSLAQGGEGLGAMWGEEKTRDYLQRAGFRSITTHRLAHDIQNNWYVVMK
jgi:2-polyprenyl-3-methyl-5-hydroxy-6-metoxy-1,4-benzoquinol methylase